TVYKDITLGPRAFVTLRRPTGEVVVSSNPYELVAHRPFPVIAHAPGDPLQGSYVRRADTDGIERLFTYRRIPEHDLVVVVGRSLDEILAPYYEQRRVYVAGGTLLSAVLLLLALLAYRRMRREAEANESLRRFRFAMDNSADIIVLVDRATMRHVDANDTACRLLGYTREELLAMGPSGILPYSDEQLAAIYDDLIANPAVRSGMRSYYRCKDGTQLPFESTRKLLRTPQGPLVVAISRDMREHIASEEALRRHGEQLAGILALQGRLADEKLDLRGICDLVVDSTRRLLGTGAAAIQFVEGEEFVYFAASAERKQLVGVRTGLRGNFSAAILESGKAILCDDTQTDPRIDAAASARAGARSLIGAPMHHQGRVVGILKLISGEPRAFHAEQLGTLELLAGIAGSAIQRKRAQDELRRSEERFRSLANLSSDWYWEQDANLRFTKFEGKPGDKRLANVPTEVLGRCAWQLGGIVREAADWDSLRRSMLAHQPFRQFEYCYESRAGARHYVSADGEPVFDEHGAFSGYRGTARDITEQRRDEEELRRFRAAMDMSHDAVFLTDRATLRFVDVNEPAWKGTGYTREELMRIGPERVLGKPREELEREYDAVIAAGEAGITVETSYRSAKGRTRWTELQRRPLRAGDRWIIVTVSRDITERKRAEELQKRHLRLQERTARFGQAALAKRDAAELIEEGVAALLEGLTADGVAYIEAVAGGGL
ncbi:MAG TPA: PAS domain S-box protein, partial [Burkholderiales bacterium]|nr:PAS domain S-box protein [Burkholderiales bacterium]